ncbi:MAG: hypothetical protein LBV04_07320 [Deferribacteraceae bacterium]|jgi:hypothetical protein|nr:hypothetical protein [Deferribacteraceae bacterium]
MKIYKITFIALLFLLLQLPAFAQFESAFTEENFAKQPPLTEVDFKAFLKSEAVYRYLEDGLQSSVTLEEANAYVQKELGISAERFLYVAAKLAICYTVMYDRGLSAAEQQSFFATVPPYFSANANEQGLIEKYKVEIEAIFAKFNA